MVNPLELILVTYYVVFYHIIYLVLSKTYDYIERYYYIIINPVLWILSIIAIYFVVSFTSVNKSSFFILSFYLITTYIITIINTNNKHFFLLGIMISLFQSEFWELPIYFYNYFILPQHITFTNQSFIFALSSFVKLLTLYEIIIIFKKLGFNYNNMVKNLLIFLTPYSVAIIIYYKIHGFYYNIFPTTIYLFIFRILCSLLFFTIIYKENKFIYDRNNSMD